MSLFRRTSMLGFAMALSLASGCIGASGGETFAFDAAAAGPEDAVAGQPLHFTTPAGFDVTLTQAVLHVGAVYMNESLPNANQQTTDCISDGRYTAQVRAGVDVDLLSPVPRNFPVRGAATSTHSRAGEVWLMGGADVAADDDSTPILQLEGTATRDADVFPFKARLTIGQNRKRPPPTPAQPGANPICRERIVAPIPIDVLPEEGGNLLVRIDPRKLFTIVDFAELREFSTDPPLFGFEDEAVDAPSIALYDAMRSAPLYSFVWR